MTIRKHVLILCLLPLAAGAALADSDDFDKAEGRSRAALVVTDAATMRECSECHIAYAPGFLPARSRLASSPKWSSRLAMIKVQDRAGRKPGA